MSASSTDNSGNNSNNSVKSIIEEQIKGSVETILSSYATQLSDWFNQNKDVEITPEELRQAFDVPLKPVTPSTMSRGISTIMPDMPGYLAGSATPKKRGGRTKKEVDPSLPQCEYVKTKGKDPGSQCGNKVLNDGSLGADHYCKQCLKKASVKNKLEGDGVKTTVQPPNMPGSKIKVEKEPEEPTNELQVMPIDGRDGFFREANHGFIVEQTEDGNIVATAICPDGEEERPLNDNERKIAQGLGLEVIKPETPKAKMPTKLAMPVAQIPKANPKS